MIDLYKKEEQMIKKMRSMRNAQIGKCQFAFLDEKHMEIISTLCSKSKDLKVPAKNAEEMYKSIEEIRLKM